MLSSLCIVKEHAIFQLLSFTELRVCVKFTQYIPPAWQLYLEETIFTFYVFLIEI